MNDVSSLVGQQQQKQQILQQSLRARHATYPNKAYDDGERSWNLTNLTGFETVIERQLAPIREALERIERSAAVPHDDSYGRDISPVLSPPSGFPVPAWDLGDESHKVPAETLTAEDGGGGSNILTGLETGGLQEEKERSSAPVLSRGMSLSDMAESPNRKSWLNQMRRRWRFLLENMEEPERTGRLNSVVTSEHFEHIASLTICFNAIFVAITSDWEMRHIGGTAPFVMKLVERLVFGWYVLEVLLRFCNHRLYFFINKERTWNWFDFVLVWLSALDMGVSTATANMSGGSDVSFMRIFRLLKLAKVLRTFRVMRVFKDLSLIIESFRKSVTALFWTLVMLIFVIYVFALIFLQGLTGYLADGWTVHPEEEEENIRMYFGSVITSMLSLYMSMTGGHDWRILFNVVSLAGKFYSVLFLSFTFLIIFAVFNILTGVFVEKAVVAAEPAREEVILEQHRKKEEDMKEFRHMCHLLDDNRTGTITRDEVCAAMGDELMTSYMAAIGLQVRDNVDFFDMVGIDQEEVSINEFVDGCMALRGAATYMDMQKLWKEVAAMQKQSAATEERVNDVITMVEGLPEQLGKSLEKHQSRHRATLTTPAAPAPPSARQRGCASKAERSCDNGSGAGLAFAAVGDATGGAQTAKATL